MSDNPLLNLNPDDLAGMSLQNLESLEQVFSKGLIGKTLLSPEELQGLLVMKQIYKLTNDGIILLLI